MPKLGFLNFNSFGALPIHVIRNKRKWDILKFVAQHNKIDESQGNPEDYIQLLNNFVILEYRDDNGPWYDVNPLIKGLL